jgi:F-type H+-transporting ATPase subunit b
MHELFSAFGVSWGLLLAQAVNFGILLLALGYFLYTPVLTMLNKRRELVAESVKEAKQMAELFAHADDEAKRRVDLAEEEAEKIVASARDAASAEKTRLLKEAESRAASALKEAETRATETVARARRESDRDIARLTILAAETILKNHA